MSQLVESLYAEIEKIQAIDIHSHVRQLEPSAASLRELLSYHYYTELAFSCGLPKDKMAAALPDEKMVPALLERMAEFDNTVQYGWIIELAGKLFDFKDRRLTVDNWKALSAAAAKRLGGKDWPAEVLRRGSLEKVFLTNTFTEDLDGFDREVLVPCLRCDDLVFNTAKPATLEGLAKRTGVTVKNVATLKQAIHAVFDYFVKHDAKCAAISLTPEFVCLPVKPSEAEPLLTAALQGEPLDADETARLRSFVLYLLADGCREFKVPMQLMIGAVRSAYEHGVTSGTDVVANTASLGQYTDLFNRFHDVTFTVSYLSPTMAHELVTYTWIFQNVRASGHWWYTNIPGYIEADLRCRIEALPRTKLLGYYSDAYYIEFTLPKFNMYRWCLARVLAGQLEMKRMTEDEAMAVATALLRDNPKRIFNV
ncbi:MAG: glucuronate isomerase [Planctomycetes bacterium]|nr:glucuronate isomerase [Planctomycetota bacterium]